MLDRFISSMPAEADDDLMLCRRDGLAYQADRKRVIDYGSDYWDTCANHPPETVDKLNRQRIAFVDKYVGVNRVVDVGIGDGSFIKARGNTYGRDINPVAIAWLKNTEKWAECMSDFAGMTLWDCLEHVPEPEKYLQCIRLHGYLFVSIPVFPDLDKIRESRHYRPAEHLYYFSSDGFVRWMGMHGFVLLEISDHETKAGRDSILSYAFRRFRWPADISKG